LRRFLNWAIWLPITILVVGFAVANRQWVNVSFDPFNAATPYAAITMPLWALLFCGLFIGAIAGWLICWLSQGKWRKSAREARSELRRTASELNSLKQAPPVHVPTVPETRETLQ
jgi:uncharacterized membrane protein YciS (DUF1049 family)